MDELVINGIYLHFKGEDRLYQVVGIARDADDVGQRQVVYQQLYDSGFPNGTIWTRKLEDFMSSVDKGGKLEKRFTLVEQAHVLVDVEGLNKATEDVLELNLRAQEIHERESGGMVLDIDRGPWNR